MTKTQSRGFIIIFIFFLLLALYKDITNEQETKEGTLQREAVGGKEQEIVLILDAEDILEDYSYELHIEPQKITKDEAAKLFEETKNTIEKDFAEIGKELPVKEKYCNGQVKVKWKFENREYIDVQGEIHWEEIPKDGCVCTAEVQLSCGDYEEVYRFPFRIYPIKKSQNEELLEKLEEYFYRQMSIEGEDKIQLPKEINSVSLQWEQEKSFYTLQVLILGVITLFLLKLGQKKENEQKEKKRVQMFQMEYAEVVNQLAMLVETGMPLRQTWNKISKQYERTRAKNLIEKKEVFEAIVRMNRRLCEGETERVAYEGFAEEINVRCYRQLMRMLINQSNKGCAGLSAYLEEECRRAYAERMLTAKKIGEEASTRMLLPLMLMMILVMGIVLLPAIIQLVE